MTSHLDALRRATLSPDLDPRAVTRAARELSRRGRRGEARALLERAERRLTPHPHAVSPNEALVALRRARFDLGLYRYHEPHTCEWLGWPPLGPPRTRWQRDASPGLSWTSSCLAVDAHLLLIQEHLPQTDETALCALAPATGELLWRHERAMRLIDSVLDEETVLLQWYRRARTGSSAIHRIERLERSTGRLLASHTLERWCYRVPFLRLGEGRLALVGIAPESTGVPERWMENKQLGVVEGERLRWEAFEGLPRATAFRAALRVVWHPFWHRRQLYHEFFGSERAHAMVRAELLESEEEHFLLTTRQVEAGLLDLSLWHFASGEALLPIELSEPPRRSLAPPHLWRSAGRHILDIALPENERWTLNSWLLGDERARRLTRPHPAEPVRALMARALYAGGVWWWHSEDTRRVYGEVVEEGAVVPWVELPIGASESHERSREPRHPVLSHVVPCGPWVWVLRGSQLICLELR